MLDHRYLRQEKCPQLEQSLLPRQSRLNARTRRIKSGILIYIPVAFPTLSLVHSAYIAASRRSDRSLEARVESARRASEIHKRRTGRSLRVTEQDVINEQMYEEEDDDLPVQYQRLTAHLQTGSVDFNRRLAAYLTNQVAMRNAMDQMINNSYAQQYPNAPRFAHNGNQSTLSPPLSGGDITQSPSTVQRLGPYPSPHQPGFKHPHNRPYSTATPNEMPQPGAPHSSSPPFAGPQERGISTPGGLASPPALFRPLKPDAVKPDPDRQRQTQSATTGMSDTYPPLWQDMGLFTTSLPPESQQMLGPALDPRDPTTSMLMAGSEPFTSSPYYPWGNSTSAGKLEATRPTFGSMFSTLAPIDLVKPEDFSATAAKPGRDLSNISSAPSAGLDFNSSQDGTDFKGTPGFGTVLTRESSAAGLDSGQITPGEGFWDSFVQDGGWAEETPAN